MTEGRPFRRRASVAIGLIALLVALLPPVAYFAISYQYLRGSLDAQAELSARTLTGLVMANPRTWHFEQLRIVELLERRPLTKSRQARRVIDTDGNLVAEHADHLAPPLLARSRPIHDAGFVVGRVEVVESLRPLVNRSALLGLASVLLGLVVYLAFGHFPLRVMQQALDSRDESERRYRALYLSMGEGMVLFRVVVGAGGATGIEFVGANPALERMLGVPLADLGTAPAAAFLRDALLRHALEVRDGGAVRSALKFEAEEPGGARVCSVSVFSPQPGLLAALVEDLTLARRAEQEREVIERRMQDTQKLEGLGILAGGIAHDFNNLLVGILGNIDLALLQSGAAAPAAASLRQAEKAARRAADLANQMLAYSGRGRFVIEAIDLSRLVEEMGTLLAAAVAKVARLRLHLAPDLPAIEADATQLRQVVMNLITNASDAIGERDGTIDVATGLIDADRAYLDATAFGDSLAPGRYVWLEVADTGSGMDAETSRRIFDPFFTTKAQGRGLGLAAALGIVRGHRGTLSVASAPGAGTSFRVLFPAATGACAGRAAAAGDGGGGAAAAVARGADAASRPAAGAVLVVDDEEQVRGVVRGILEAQGFTVLTAVDGIEGLELLRAHREMIAAVLLDMTMPRMGGLEACRQMRSIAPEVPVVVCSGYADGDAAEQCADGFLRKPFRLQALVDALREAIGRAGRVPPSPSV